MQNYTHKLSKQIKLTIIVELSNQNSKLNTNSCNHNHPHLRKKSKKNIILVLMQEKEGIFIREALLRMWRKKISKISIILNLDLNN